MTGWPRRPSGPTYYNSVIPATPLLLTTGHHESPLIVKPNPRRQLRIFHRKPFLLLPIVPRSWLIYLNTATHTRLKLLKFIDLYLKSVSLNKYPKI